MLDDPAGGFWPLARVVLALIVPSVFQRLLTFWTAQISPPSTTSTVSWSRVYESFSRDGYLIFGAPASALIYS